MGEETQAPLQHWTNELEPRELAQIRHATAYAASYADAGAPGHGQFILLAKLAKLLDAREQAITFAQGRPVIRKVVRDEQTGCWRDVYTGVQVDV